MVYGAARSYGNKYSGMYSGEVSSEVEGALKGKPNYNPGFIEKLSNSADFTLDEDFESVKGRVVAALKKKKFKFTDESQDGAHAWCAWKGKIGRFGSDFTHISLFLILAGAILGSALRL